MIRLYSRHPQTYPYLVASVSGATHGRRRLGDMGVNHRIAVRGEAYPFNNVSLHSPDVELFPLSFFLSHQGREVCRSTPA